MPRPPPRLHLDGPLDAGTRRVLDDGRAHHLRHVLRLADGDPVRVFNAAAGEWHATLHAEGRRGTAIAVADRARPPAPPDADAPALLFAPLKRDATDLVVRAGTELGAAAFHPVLTARTVAGRVNTERLALIAREAAEQCERLDVPPVAEPRPLAAVLDGWRGPPIAAALERGGARPLGRPGNGAPFPGAVLIGPEGGWTADERAMLGRHQAVCPVSLGPLVLRAETAAIAALALLRSEHRRTMHPPMAPSSTPDRADHVEPG